MTAPNDTPRGGPARSVPSPSNVGRAGMPPRTRTVAGTREGWSGTPDAAWADATNGGLLNQADKHETTTCVGGPTPNATCTNDSTCGGATCSRYVRDALITVCP